MRALRAASPVRAAFLWAWLVLTLVTVPVLLAPLLLPSQTIFALTPVCERKVRYGQECVLCGMTRSFVLVARGKFKEASQANTAGLPLFAALLSNQLVALCFLSRRILHRQPRITLGPTETPPWAGGRSASS
jgi:hypothetical protein